MAPEFTAEEARHWFLPKKDSKQVIWSYVVENNGKITDFFSFFCVESSIIKNNDVLRVAYLFYYASETGLSEPFDKPSLKTRLNALINDALILAKRAKLDVFNALSLMDNALFLEQQSLAEATGSSITTCSLSGQPDFRRCRCQESAGRGPFEWRWAGDAVGVGVPVAINDV
ncbi:glycylpeptide N-tetradecanoyltransferase [Metarhizium acridum]|nr:glycylpeptide N-tetradecanoyltransferase [Metarhizium acridum]